MRSEKDLMKLSKNKCNCVKKNEKTEWIIGNFVQNRAVQLNGTKEQEEALLKVISELKNNKGALMPILQKV